MHNINYITSNPQEFDALLQSRNCNPCAALVIKLDNQIKSLTTQLQDLQQNRNNLAKQIGAIKKSGGDASSLMDESTIVKDKIPPLESSLEEYKLQLNNLLATLPNVLSDEVPAGADEASNIVVRKHMQHKREFDFEPKTHEVLAADMLDLEQASKVSGARFSYLYGWLASLEQALICFMLHENKKRGYQHVSPPLLVHSGAMFGTGQLPKFAEDSYTTTNGLSLIPTSEVSLANIVANQILPHESLPKKFMAATPCFRSEAGSAGKDMKGIFRQHQFWKVELVSVTSEHQSEEEHIHMLETAENILQKLAIPYRVVLLSSGDTGFASSKTYDIEVWLPGQNAFREISSVSNCLEFQARRMNSRYKDIHTAKNKYVHTLNGSSLAVGRTLIALLENYQNSDGTISVPEVLKPYMALL